MNRNIQLLVITLFIVGFPAVSWYYLNQGYNYRMQIEEELAQELGRIPDFQLVNQNGKTVANQSMNKKVVVANFLDVEAVGDSKIYMDRLYKIQDQFDKADDILFYTYIKDGAANIQNYVSSLGIKEEKQWHFLTGTEAEMNQFIQAFPFSEDMSKKYAGNVTVAIVDTSSVIRYFYDISEEKQAGKLVEHIANLMPQAPAEEARMKRELEK